MTVNGADKSNSLVADIDFLLFGTSTIFNTEYSLIDRIRNINISWDDAVAELYKADPMHKWDDTTNPDLPFATLDLSSTLDNYSLLDTALVIHRVRVKDQNGEYRTLIPVLRSELTDSELNATGTPEKYYKIGGVVFPIPIPNYGYPDGIELEFQRGANHFTTASTDESPGFNSQFHQFISIGAALRYAIANGMNAKTRDLSTEKERLRMAIREHYQLRSPDERPRMRLRKRSVGRYGL